MTTTPPEAPPPPHPTGDPGPRVAGDQVRDLGRLRRSRTDRKVAGVAGGLARHLDVDPLVLRVAFVVLVFFGGAGLILYGAAWLLVPEDGAPKAPFHLDERSRGVALVLVGVVAALALIGDSWGAFGFPWPVAVVALIALWLLTRGGHRTGWTPPPGTPEAGDPPTGPVTYQPAPPVTSQTGWLPPPTYVAPPAYVRPPHPRKRGPILFWLTIALVALAEGVLGLADVAGAPVADSAYPAAAVGICGLMLVVGAFVGRAGGIIAVGLVAALGLAVTTAADRIDADSVTERPVTAAEVESDYSLGAGEQRIDLSRVADVAALDGRTITIDGDIGSIDVTVPDTVRVRVDASVDGPGEVKLFGADRNGWGVEDSALVGDPAAPFLTLELTLDVGSIEVTH